MWFFKRQPKAVIVVSRITGNNEQVSVTLNSYETDKVSLYNIIKEAAEAVQERLVQNNIIAYQGLDLKNPKTEKAGD